MRIQSLCVLFIAVSLQAYLARALEYEALAPGRGLGTKAKMADPESHISQDDLYGGSLRYLLDGPFVTKESVKRRQLLTRLGPEAEEIIQSILGDNEIKIAIFPLGSTLHGYAAQGSDVDYGICNLNEFTMITPTEFKHGTHSMKQNGPPAKINFIPATTENQIYQEVNRLIEREGYQAGGLRLPPMSDFKTAGSEAIIEYWLSHNASALSYVFLPIAYGDSKMVEKARRNIIFSLANDPAPQEKWIKMKEYLYREVLKIDLYEVLQKPHLQQWLIRQGVDVNSILSSLPAGLVRSKLNQYRNGILDQFRENREGQIGLPSFDEMFVIYSDLLEQSTVSNLSGNVDSAL